MNQVKEFCMIKTDTDRLSHMEKEAYVLAQHPFKITKLSTSGRYNTYIKFRGKRINIKTVTYEQMIDKLFEHYFGDTYDDDGDIVSDWEENSIRCDFCGTEVSYKNGIIFCPNCEAEYDKDELEAYTGGKITITHVGPGGIEIHSWTL